MPSSTHSPAVRFPSETSGRRISPSGCGDDLAVPGFEVRVTQPVLQGTTRNDAIDIGRIVGSIAVISAHIAPGDIWTERVAAATISCHVPFFYLVAMIFFMTGLPRTAEAKECLQKLQSRILVPFIAWTAIYVTMMWIKGAVTGQARVWDWVGILFYGQGAVHLYFLTVLLWMQVTALGVFEISRGRCRVRWALVLLVLFGFAGWGRCQDYLGWAEIISAPLFMLAARFFAGFRNLPKIQTECVPLEKQRLTRICAGLTLFIMATSLTLGGIQFRMGGDNLSPLLGAIGFYLVLSCLRLEINTRIGKTILSASYGVYLSHFLFIEGIEFILEKLNLLPRIYTWQQEIIFTGVVFAMGLFAVVLIRKFTVPRRILLGEA